MATVINPFVAVDGNGNVRASAKLYFYQTGTTTLQNTYADAALSAVNTNPVVADSSGLFPAIYLGDPPTYTAYKAILKTSADVTVWTADPIAGAPLTTPVTASLLRGYLSGLGMTSRTTTTITYAAGIATDSTNTVVMNVAAATINCATVGALGLDAGGLGVNTWYHAFAISKTDGTTSLLASTSASSPTMPSGYTYKRRIGSFKTDGSSQIIAFIQNGDYYNWLPIATDILVTNPGISAVTATLTVPTGVKVRAQIASWLNNGSNANAVLYLSDLAMTDSTPQTSGALSLVGGAAAATTFASAEFQVWTNTSGQIRYRLSASGASDVVAIFTKGWMDRRGRDD